MTRRNRRRRAGNPVGSPPASSRLTLATVAAALLAAGCASGGVPPGPATVQRAPAGPPQGYVRSVTPFPVFDESGEPYQIPFLGGFNVPRPQWVDIDADGDLDLFVQETTNRLLFFEREDTPEGRRHTWRPEAYADLEVGEWFRFVDVDGDEDRDLLAESPFSYMKLYRNTGTTGGADLRTHRRHAEGHAGRGDLLGPPEHPQRGGHGLRRTA